MGQASHLTWRDGKSSAAISGTDLTLRVRYSPANQGRPSFPEDPPTRGLRHIPQAGLAPEDVPAESRFLLEINVRDINNTNVETQQYWILAINAALTAQRLQRARGARSKRILDKVNRKLPSRTKMGIVAVEQQIRSDQCHFLPQTDYRTAREPSDPGDPDSNGGQPDGSHPIPSQPVISSPQNQVSMTNVYSIMEKQSSLYTLMTPYY